MNEEKSKKTWVGRYLNEHSDVISDLIAYGSLAVIFGTGYYVGSKSSARYLTRGWKIDRIRKGVSRDTGNNAMEIFHRNGVSQLWELAPGETIP